MLTFGCSFSGLCKRSENGAPQGGDMRSVHAGARFVRIDRCCLGSILGSILEWFWEPSSQLYSFLVAEVANRVPKEVSFWRCVFAYLF